jgi:anti-anti-sigma regulatory factor
VTESGLPLPVCRVFSHPYSPGVRLVGELDLSNRSILLGALAVLQREDADVRIDISELEFIDVAGIGELVAFTHEHRPRRVIVEAPSPLVRRVIAVAWGDDALDYGD